MSFQSSFEAGYATVDFTPEAGLPLMGQMHERISQGTRDPLQVNAIALRHGETTAIIASVDICMIDTEQVEAMREEWTAKTGLPAQSLIIHSTHTHDGPAMVSWINQTAVPGFPERVMEATVRCAQDALSRLEPVEVYAGTGYMEQMGWNRRAMFEDGTSRMYSHSEMPGFIGLEGPRDPALPVLFTKNAEEKVTGVLVNFATHPNSIEGAYVYSADVPGAARRWIKRFLGEEVSVVYLTGAAGNTAPSILDPLDEAQPWREDAGLERSGQYLAGEAVKVIASTIRPMENPVLRLEHAELQIGMRQWPEKDSPQYYQSPGNHYYERSEREWAERMRTLNPVKTNVDVLRIGDSVVCANPAELFVEFGLQIRAASPAKFTFISELTNGCVGYVPTPLAFQRGGYETWCAPSSQLETSAGDQIVAATKELLQKAF